MEKCTECMVLYSMQYKSKVIVKKVTPTVYIVVQKYACSQESNTKESNTERFDFLMLCDFHKIVLYQTRANILGLVCLNP